MTMNYHAKSTIRSTRNIFHILILLYDLKVLQYKEPLRIYRSLQGIRFYWFHDLLLPRYHNTRYNGKLPIFLKDNLHLNLT
jgi:hypothetical protein